MWGAHEVPVKGLKIPPIMRPPVRGVATGISAKARLAFWQRAGVYVPLSAAVKATYTPAKVAALLRQAQWRSPRDGTYN